MLRASEPNPIRKRVYPLPLFVALTLAGILAILLYVGEHLNQQAIEAHWYPAQACQLPEDTCYATLGQERQLSFRLLTEQPLPLEPLPIEVQLEGWSAAEQAQLIMEVDLQGRDMYMGYNRTQLHHQGEGLFSGIPRLSLCTDEVMVWRASVLIYPEGDLEAQPLATYFDFVVDQRLFRSGSPASSTVATDS
ncbi:hypothetical protein [Marinospirillum sp.]|uniref:hypothetical protein n=1 Tax=Marinospirillum sp. TaxID=2183934 RepID=UPI003A8B9A21